ncbi:MAG: NAD(P)H-quinone oxidoreductase [Ferrovum sp.]|nr:NAD(P)H-quinone oxidoreductase [Ferrovum sp.]
MGCVEISSSGGPEVLKWVTRPRPHPGLGEVLIRVDAAGINRPDCFQRAGFYPPPADASDLPGLEVAGEVVAVGEGVTLWNAGDRVCALVAGGGYAEYCVAPALTCLPYPQGFTSVMAAGLPETFFTVWSNVFDRAALKPGETFLVQGGGSGIGTTAIQLARALGHRVFATAGSAEKCAACESLGAERAINYTTEDFVEVIRAQTHGCGVDVILDMVGGDYIPREMKALAEDGRLVLIAFLRGSKGQVDLADMMRRRLTLTGSTLRARGVDFKAEVARKLHEKVWPLLETGKIKPVIHAQFPLHQASLAHELMESSTHIGKIVLTVDHP